MSVTHIEQTIEDPHGRPQTVLVHIGESPLAWLRARGHLNERYFIAGEKLRADWEKAGLGARVTRATTKWARRSGAAGQSHIGAVVRARTV